MITNLNSGWKILQDVHDAGEKLGIFEDSFHSDMGNQISEWEDLPELKQLQLIYASQPYFGRELRYFNNAPWWYKNSFMVSAESAAVKVKFTNVDYFCKIWVNGCYVGEHEGYSMPFEFEISDKVKFGQENSIVVKVWSPWDKEILDDNEKRRTFLVVRDNIKGTYEHSDTFVQRDVNPVGIYGTVSVEVCTEASFDTEPEINYTLSEDLSSAEVRVSGKIRTVNGGQYFLRISGVDDITKQKVYAETVPVAESGAYDVSSVLQNVVLWNTWDKGGAYTYTFTVELLKGKTILQSYSHILGFRKIEMVRDTEKTRFYLNGKAFYVRGTSYFPDVYVSNMCEERYRRDLMNVKAAGFNLIRIHVHVDLPIMYEICTELGIGIMQDSEYNWMHPATDEFAERFINIYLATVSMLKKHTSMFCWICMNEPGLEDPMGKSSGRAMTINPGPKLYESVKKLDPTRPIIKGSFCEDDLTSGDSHNYIGSLNGEEGHYSDIYGTTEKFNTEYGFDAPPCVFSLKNCSPALKQLHGITNRFKEIQNYQYKLLKYYTEHYRMQKYAPNSGYVQFLFNDMCPQSFYGIFDWWGLPKAGAEAIYESNAPLGAFLKFSREHIDEVYVVNDNMEEIKNVDVTCVITDEEGTQLFCQTVAADLPADGIVKLWNINISKQDQSFVSCALIVKKNGKILTKNHYEDIFNMPEHVKGHPSRINHEIGVRLYFS